MYHSVDNDTENPQWEPELKRAGRFWNKDHVHGHIVHNNHRPDRLVFNQLPLGPRLLTKFRPDELGQQGKSTSVVI